MEIPKGSKVCIICHEVVTSGTAAKVVDDSVIKAIRGIKRLFGISQNNELYVCTRDMEKYREKRKKFEKEFMLMGAVALVIILLLSGVPLLSGRFQISLFISSLFIAILLFLFAVLFKYVPQIGQTVDFGAGSSMQRNGQKMQQKKQPKEKTGTVEAAASVKKYKRKT